MMRAPALHAEETLFPVLRRLLPSGPLGGAKLRGRVRGGCPPQTRGRRGRGPGLAPLRRNREKSTEFTGHSFMNVKKGIPASYTQCVSRRGGNPRPGPPALLPPI